MFYLSSRSAHAGPDDSAPGPSPSSTSAPRAPATALLAVVALLAGAAGLLSSCGGGGLKGSPDGRPDGAGGAGGRDAGGGSDVPADGTNPDAGDLPGTLPDGRSCAASSECRSGHCVDGVCCATACTGTCQSCATPGAIGTCLPAEVGTDP